MANKKLWLGTAVLAMVLCGILTSCATSTVRGSIPQTAVTLQRITSNVNAELPMQIFLDNVPYDFVNGAPPQTVLVNNGEHIAYAVIGDQETRTVQFTAKSQIITINAGYKAALLGLVAELVIEVK